MARSYYFKYSLCSQNKSILVVAACSLAFAVIVHFGLLLYQGKQTKSNQQFAFMRLPPEIRAHVFHYLLHPPNEQVSHHSTALSNLIAITTCLVPLSYLPQILQPRSPHSPMFHHLNNMCLVSKQFCIEFLFTYFRQGTPAFIVDASKSHSDKFFHISATSLSQVRRCTLKVLATPGIAGAFNPREARIANWTSKDSIFKAMRHMDGLNDMTLSIEACGNQMWNPPSLWHFVSQAFKECEIKAFKRIDFAMKGWCYPVPNHLQRRESDISPNWVWQCENGHLVMLDEDGELPLRRFCNNLFAECRTCEGTEEEDTLQNETN